MIRKSSTPLYAATVIIAIVVWVGSLILVGVFMNEGSRTEDLGKDLKPEDERRGLEERTERTDYAPASWAFSIWFFIYLWQAVFLLYSILSIFTRFNLERVPMPVFPFYTVANIGGAGWAICDRYDAYWLGVAFIAAMPLALYISMIISIYDVYKRKFNYFLYTYTVHNALAIYAGWVSVAVLLYIGMSMMHAGPDVEKQLTGTIMLSVLASELVLFIILEHTFLEKMMRHIWAHYISLVVAIVGSIAKNWDPENHNSILTVAIAGFVACSICVKMMRMVSEKCSRPDKPAQSKDDLTITTTETTDEKKYLA